MGKSPLSDAGRGADEPIPGMRVSETARRGSLAEAFTGQPGRYVSIKDTIVGFREIVEGKHDDLTEQAFYMVGSMEEAMEKARKLSEAA